jgi:hypothetical protein
MPFSLRPDMCYIFVQTAFPVFHEFDADGTIRINGLHWEGFPRLAWEAHSAAGYTTPPTYEVSECRTETANKRGGSEWESIKILLEGDGNSNKMSTASNTRLRLTTKVGQDHVDTGVPLDLGTNTHTLPTRERSGTPNLESTNQHPSDR